MNTEDKLKIIKKYGEISEWTFKDMHGRINTRITLNINGSGLDISSTANTYSLAVYKLHYQLKECMKQTVETIDEY